MNDMEWKEFIKTRVDYEWTVEQTGVGKENDIIDTYQIQLWQWPTEENYTGCKAVLLLKRYSGSNANGVKEIGHAYVVDGKLEPTFDSGHVVPKRYMKALDKLLGE